MTGDTETVIPIARCQGLSNWETVSDTCGWSLGDYAKVRLWFDASCLGPVPQPLVIIEFAIRVDLPASCYAREVAICEAGIRLQNFTVYSSRTTTARVHLLGHKLKTGRIQLELYTKAVPLTRDAGDELAVDARGVCIEDGRLICGPAADETKQTLIAAGATIARTLFPDDVLSDRFWNAAELIGRIRAAIDGKTPYSLVRLGDGEGRILGYPWLITEAETQTDTIHYMFGSAAMARLVRRFGPAALQAAMAELSHLILQSATNADALGLPSPVFFERQITAAVQNSVLGSAAALIVVQKALAFRPKPLLVDTFMFRYVQTKQLFPKLLAGLPFLGVIAHTDQGPALAAHFGIRDVRTYRIPGHFSFMAEEQSQFPDLYKDIVARIAVPFQGAVFLVAAGYLGKCYCDAIKQKGGIALDIGSVFDGWFGQGRPDAMTEALRLRPA